MAANREYAESTAMKRGIIIHDSIFSRRTMDHSECSKIGNIIFSGGAPWKRVKSPWGEDFVHVNQKEYVLKMSQVIIHAQLRIMRIISYWSLRFIYCDAIIRIFIVESCADCWQISSGRGRTRANWSELSNGNFLLQFFFAFLVAKIRTAKLLTREN